jgi:large subunit ribosomal protein L9
MQARLQEARAKKAVEDKQEAETLAGKIEGYVVKTEVKVDPDGHMYGSVTSLDVLRLLQAEGFELERRSVHLLQPIKATGIHQISLRLKEGVTSTIQLKIVPEGYVESEEPAVVSEEASS